VSVQDRCKVCEKCTILLEIVLDTPDGTHCRRGSSESLVQSEIVLIMTQDSFTVYAKRIIGLEIILDAPDCTTR
jgi:hypothetical protein